MQFIDCKVGLFTGKSLDRTNDAGEFSSFTLQELRTLPSSAARDLPRTDLSSPHRKTRGPKRAKRLDPTIYLSFPCGRCLSNSATALGMKDCNCPMRVPWEGWVEANSGGCCPPASN